MATAVQTPSVPGLQRMDFDEWLAWSEREGPPTEWVAGEVIVFAMPNELHQDVVLLLATLLQWYARRLNLGKVLIAPIPMRILGGARAREPDILFVAERHAARRRGTMIDGPADLVADDSVRRDAVVKRGEYAAAGIPEFWLLDPRPGHQRARFFLLAADGGYEEAPLDAAGRYHSPALPGFWLDPAWFWRNPLPDPDQLKPLIIEAQDASLRGEHPTD